MKILVLPLLTCVILSGFPNLCELWQLHPWGRVNDTNKPLCVAWMLKWNNVLSFNACYFLSLLFFPFRAILSSLGCNIGLHRSLFYGIWSCSLFSKKVIFCFFHLEWSILIKNNLPTESFIFPSHLIKNCVKFLRLFVPPLSPCLDSLGLTS